MSKESFVKREKDWAATLVEHKRLAIRHQFQPYKSGIKLLLRCNSCVCCQSKHGWKGYSVYHPASNSIERAFTPLSCHGDHDAVKSWTPLTSTAEAALKEFVGNHAHFTTQDLVKVVEAHQSHSRPSDTFLQTWGKNHRAPKSDACDRTTSFAWVEADWRQLEREYGLVNGLQEAPNALKIAKSTYDPAATAVCFCNPALLKTTFDRLVNHHYIKLCGDGTFRLTSGKWVLISVGVLSKHYAPASGVYAFRIAFHPLMFALTNKESQPTYRFLFDALVSCSEQFAQVNLLHACRQYHADLHFGEDLAMKSIFHHADRVADWAHLIGACARSKTHVTKEEGALAWRAGIFSTVEKDLSPFGKRLLPLVKRTIFCLRSVPTAIIFHTITDLLFRTLLAQEPPERKAVSKMQRFYFAKVPAAAARIRFELKGWPGDPSFLFSADWWCGIQRIQPGSASGIQAQESWHKRKLKAYLSLRSDLPTFCKSLEGFTRSRLHELRAHDCPLPDVPREPFPDKTVLHDSVKLTAAGRTFAHQFWRTKSYDVFAQEGTGFCCDAPVLVLPRSLHFHVAAGPRFRSGLSPSWACSKACSSHLR